MGALAALFLAWWCDLLRLVGGDGGEQRVSVLFGPLRKVVPIGWIGGR